MIIYASYSWEMGLNLNLDALFDNMWNRKGIREKTGEVNSTKAYMTHDEAMTFSAVVTQWLSKMTRECFRNIYKV